MAYYINRWCIVTYVFLGLICFVSVHSQSRSEICTQPIQSCGPFPPRLPDTYHAQMQVTMPYKNTTKYVVEYNDKINRRSVIRSVIEGELMTTYLDAKEKTMLILISKQDDTFGVENACVGITYTFNRLNYFFGFETEDNEISVKLNEGIISYEGINMEYVGLGQVRQIPAHQWTGCLHVEQLQATLSIDFYWSEWKNDSSEDSSVPLRVVIKGIFQPNPKTPLEDIYEVYDIIWFKQLVEYPPEVFELPHGLVCTGFTVHQNFPSIAQKFSMQFESFYEEKGNSRVFENTSINSIVNFNAWYDTHFDLVRLNIHEPVNTTNEQDSKKYLTNTTVMEFKTGVLYNIDEISNLCEMTLISDAEIVEKFGKIHFQSPKDFFLQGIPDTMFEFKGKYHVRDALCDVWAGQSDTQNIEWSYLDESWTEETLSTLIHRVPMQMMAYSINFKGNQRTETRRTLNIFNFVENPDTFPIDVSSCFQQDQKKHLRITFPVPSIPLTDRLIQLIKQTSRFDISQIINVSPIRIANVELNVDPNGEVFYIELTLLSLPDISGVKPEQDNVDLNKALDNLKYFIDHDSLMVVIYNQGSNEPLQLTALPNSLHELGKTRAQLWPSELPHSILVGQKASDLTNSVQNSQTMADIDKYTTGQLVGLTIGMFIVGGTIGILAMIILLMRIDRLWKRQDALQLCPQVSPGETPLTDESCSENSGFS